MKIALFIKGDIGLKILEIFKKNSCHINFLILENGVTSEYKINTSKYIAHYEECYEYDLFMQKIIEETGNYKSKFDLGILCWWPYIIKEPLLSVSSKGFLNFHPSLLPFNRGKHPNFWTFVEDTPFGVSLHWVNNSIDGGDIAFQKKINKTWLDNGETLYFKALDSMVSVFSNHFVDIVSGNIPKIPQPNDTRVRYAKELETASMINLEKNYKAKELINLIRARTFTGFPACWFVDGGKKYEIRVKITEA